MELLAERYRGRTSPRNAAYGRSDLGAEDDRAGGHAWQPSQKCRVSGVGSGRGLGMDLGLGM
jgi:hypothetical protein